MTLADRFDDDGYLVDAPIELAEDGSPRAGPWPATRADIEATLGSASLSRQHLFAHLSGFLDWFDDALVADDRREVWLRGEFAATRRDDVEDLDLVVHYNGRRLTAGDAWILRVLSAEPFNAHPGRISVTALRHDEHQYVEDRAQEIRRSMVAVRRREDGEQVRTGWLRIMDAEEVNDG